MGVLMLSLLCMSESKQKTGILYEYFVTNRITVLSRFFFPTKLFFGR